MDFLIITVALIAFVGAALAVYEWSKKRTLLSHDFNLVGQNQTEADRELERTTAAVRDRTMYDGLDDGH